MVFRTPFISVSIALFFVVALTLLGGAYYQTITIYLSSSASLALGKRLMNNSSVGLAFFPQVLRRSSLSSSHSKHCRALP
jgi:hypothetical protein